MKINLAVIRARIPKRVVMPVISLLLAVIAVFVFVNLFRSCVQSKHSNMIDLDILEPDGTINQRKIFEELIRDDSEKNMRYQRKEAF